MTKIFISQPMRGMSYEEISFVRTAIKDKIEKLYSTRVCLTNILYSDTWDNKTSKKNTALWCLGSSLQQMSEADVVVFAKGWKDYRGCVIEYAAATKYGLQVIEEEELDNDLVGNN